MVKYSPERLAQMRKKMDQIYGAPTTPVVEAQILVEDSTESVKDAEQEEKEAADGLEEALAKKIKEDKRLAILNGEVDGSGIDPKNKSEVDPSEEPVKYTALVAAQKARAAAKFIGGFVKRGLTEADKLAKKFKDDEEVESDSESNYDSFSESGEDTSTTNGSDSESDNDNFGEALNIDFYDHMSMQMDEEIRILSEVNDKLSQTLSEINNNVFADAGIKTPKIRFNAKRVKVNVSPAKAVIETQKESVVILPDTLNDATITIDVLAFKREKSRLYDEKSIIEGLLKPFTCNTRTIHYNAYDDRDPEVGNGRINRGQVLVVIYLASGGREFKVYAGDEKRSLNYPLVIYLACENVKFSVGKQWPNHAYSVLLDSAHKLDQTYKDFPQLVDTVRNLIRNPDKKEYTVMEEDSSEKPSMFIHYPSVNTPASLLEDEIELVAGPIYDNTFLDLFVGPFRKRRFNNGYTGNGVEYTDRNYTLVSFGDVGGLDVDAAREIEIQRESNYLKIINLYPIQQNKPDEFRMEQSGLTGAKTLVGFFSYKQDQDTGDMVLIQTYSEQHEKLKAAILDFISSP